MTAYIAPTRLAPRSPNRLRFTVTPMPYPAPGVDPCSECGSEVPIAPAVGEVRYRSRALGVSIAETFCLPCLPELLGFLARHGEGPLTVALYSPCAGARTHRIARLDHERAELVGMSLAARGPATLAMLARRFATVTARLHELADATLIST